MCIMRARLELSVGMTSFETVYLLEIGRSLYMPGVPRAKREADGGGRIRLKEHILVGSGRYDRVCLMLFVREITNGQGSQAAIYGI